MSSERIIPKIIHFVWAGGDNIMPRKSISAVAAWAEKYPDFEIWLWVDRQTSSYDLHIRYSQTFAPFNISVFNESLTPTPEQLAASPVNAAAAAASVSQIMSPATAQLTSKASVILKDIETQRPEGVISTPIIREMISRLRPNYGASSDCIRYRILAYGGFYIDSDVMPGKSSIRDIEMIGFPRANHVLYVDHQSQQILDLRQDLSRRMLDTFVFKSDSSSKFHEQNNIGNDTFVCTRGCPVMSIFDASAASNYILRTMEERIDATYGAYDIRDSTIRRTGPVMVKAVLSETQLATGEANSANKRYELTCDTEKVDIRRARCLEYELTEPMDNTTHWLQSKDVDVTLNEAVAKARATIQFEITHFQTIRLDDHILDIARAAKCTEKEAAGALIQVINSMLDICPAKILVAQLLHTHSETTEFYAIKNLLKAYHETINTKFDLVAKLATSDDFVNSIYREYHNDDFKALNAVQRLHVRDRICNGYCFIQHVTQSPRNIDTQALKYFREILKTYMEIMDKINPKLEAQFELKVSVLESLREMIKSEIKERENAATSPVMAAATIVRATVDKTTVDNEERSIIPGRRP